MPPLTGYTTTLPADTLVDSGVLFIGMAALGVTSGGCRFDPGKTFRNVEYDGKRSDVETLDRVIGWAPKISATIQEFGDSVSGGQIARLEPGSTEAQTGHPSTAKGSILTTSPKGAGAFLAADDYITDLRVIFERAGGGYATLHFPIALCDKWDLAGSDKNEVKITVEFTARLATADALADPGKCPFAIELRDNLPS